MRPNGGAASLVAVLRTRAERTPDRTALEFTGGGGRERAVDYAALDRRARAVAAALAGRTSRGERALLVHPPGLDYVAAFFGCLYAGVVAVPVHPPAGRRDADRLLAVAADAGASLALTDTGGSGAAEALLGASPGPAGRVRVLATDDLPDDVADEWDGRPPEEGDLAFLQYTSGSTGLPKGVMVGHGNLMWNSGAIAGALGLGPESRGVSWLPPYHDMGLIGGILQPIYSGFPCTLMSPLTFLRRPAQWLETVSEKRATVSAAPDFAYLECVRRSSPEERARLDLGSWRHALVGAEPVRAATLDGFARAFAAAGFRRSALYPCYGLAEATLFASGPEPGAEPRVVAVDRRELEGGRAVAAAGDGPAAVFTGCGDGRGDDLIRVADPERAGRECADGEVGELWISGPTVALGYWGRDAETEETFRAGLSGYGDRVFLRTGDLGFRHDGELFVTGRLKDLMVVRGRNHHPQDVEHTAAEAHCLLRRGRSAAFSVDDGTEEHVVLVHEVVRAFRAADAPEVVQAVRAAVSAGHGLRLHDVVLVRPGGVPLTTSGKVRRRECRERWRAGALKEIGALEEFGGERPPAAGAPSAESDGVLRAIAAALDLPAGEIDPAVPLVGLGMDSLRAHRLAAAMAQRGVEVSPSALLDGMTARGLGTMAADPGARISRAPRPSGDAATSAPDREAAPMQEAMWLLDNLGGGTACHISAGLTLRGPLDPELMADAVRHLVDRHDALRTCFRIGEDGTLRAAVAPHAAVEVPVLRFADTDDRGARDAEVRRLTAELAGRPFDLTTGPLIRVLLVRVARDEWLLGVVVHHIALDGWSLALLVARLGECYAALAAGDEPPAYPAANIDGGGPAIRPGEAHDFWKDRLAGARPIELPTDRPRPAVPSWDAAALPVDLPAAGMARVRALAAEHRATPFMVLLAAFAVVMERWSGQTDLVIGTPSAGRDRPGMDGLVGMYVSTLPLRIDASEDPSFTELLERVRSTCLEAYPHPDVPQQTVSRAGGTSLVRAMLALQNLRLAPWTAGGVTAVPRELPAPGAQFELSVHLAEAEDGSLSGHAVYATDLFDEDSVRGMLTAFRTVLDQVPAAPDLPVGRLRMLTASEAERMVREFGGGDPGLTPPALVHDLIRAAGDRARDDLAVSADDRSLTFAELDAAAGRVARRLHASGHRPRDLVAVCLPRASSLVAALIGVLKAGGAYLPIDPSAPPGRVDAQIEDARPRLLLTTGRTAEEAGLARLDGVRLVLLDAPDPATPEASGTAPTPPMTPDDLANVLYTSGSTGRPKGVMTAHGALAGRLAWMRDAWNLAPGEVVLHKTPIGFDVAGWELLGTLAAGATVRVARPEGHRDPAYIAREISEHGVTTCHFVPSMLAVFLDEPAAAGCAGTLRRVVCSGETLPRAVARRFHEVLPGVELHNLYGPAETAIEVSAHRVRPDGGNGRVPIGRPIAGARLYVLDAQGRPAPPHVPGELHVGGPPVARGYLGRAALTAERFVPDPFAAGGRLYRTGDRASWRPDGVLEFLGRLDDQIKIRGHRIEPGEVSAVLEAHPDVGRCAVAVRRGPDDVPRLVAFVTPAGPRAPEAAALRDFLAGRLPAAAVPAAFVGLDALPLTANGKIDRSALAALPEPAEPAPRRRPPVPPRDPVERELVEIWRDVLGVPEVSVTDDLFALGGHSLMAVRIVGRIRALFGVQLPVAELFAGGATVERLAASLLDRLAEETDPVEFAAALRLVGEPGDGDGSPSADPARPRDSGRASRRGR